jgi:hypothetical protein
MASTATDVSAGENAGVSNQVLARAAAQNNAEWCHVFCGTHGVVGSFDVAIWSSPVRTPLLYPDAVTLLPEITIERGLSGSDTSEGCGVKDSFASLDLGADGFRPLLRAEWVVRKPTEGRYQSASGWSAVTTEAELREWEATRGEVPGGSNFFRPSLLKDQRIAVLASHNGDRIVAGVIANRSASVIGLSNLFDGAGDLESTWVSAAAAAATLWGDMPIVSYDLGDSLAAAHGAGFDSVGELTVWLKAA